MREIEVLPPADGTSVARLTELMMGHTENPEVTERAARACMGKTVLVTGAGGSIGAAICDKLADMEPHKVVMFDVSEAALYRAHRDVSFDPRFVPIIGDIRDRDKLAVVMEEYQPTLCLHAAALKHVDMLEIPLNLAEAVSTNVLGTDRVCAAAAARGCQVVMISTDKAVNPASVLGLTKRIAERIVSAWAAGGRNMSVVRFGNVMNSSGSVIPLFRKQIEMGGPVRVTDIEMTRYMMTISQAVELVLASACRQPGLHVLDMGDPIKIIDLACVLIAMADKKPADVGIVEIGMRPGEKLHEDLLYPLEESMSAVEQGMRSVMLPVPPDPIWWEIKRVLDMDLLRVSREYLMERLRAACPEYVG